MKLKKVLSIILVAALIGTFAVACSNDKPAETTAPAVDSEEPEDSSSETQRRAAADETLLFIGLTDHEETYGPLWEDYKARTGIEIKAEYYSFNDIFEVIETKAGAGAADFDAFSVDVTYISKYGNSGYLAPLDSYFSEDEKAQWTDADYAAGLWDGVLYAVPRNTSAQILWYNKTLLDEAGIVLPENDGENRLTYEQLADIAKQGLEALDSNGTEGLIGLDYQQVSRIYQMNMLPNSMGGANIGDDGLTVDGVINTQPWIDAMTWYQTQVNEGISSQGLESYQLEQFFYSGNMFFMLGGTWTPSSIEEGTFELGATYAPAFEGYEDKVATGTGSWFYGINSQTDKLDIAADFVKDMSLGEGSDQWLDARNDMPARKSRLDAVMSEDSDAPEFMKIGAYEALNTAFPRAATPAFGEYSTILDATWEDIRNGADVEGALNSAVEQINAATAVYRLD